MRTLDDRKLTAILSIDVVGYSAAVERNEAEAVGRVETLRARIETLAAASHGRVFSTAGDGFMVAFELPSAAMSVAMKLLEEAAAPGAAIPGMRMGLHIGEVLASGSDLLGHGVNVAARLMSLAAPNGLLLSDSVRTALRGKSAASLVCYGQVRLAKMREVVTAYGYAPDALGQRLRTLYRVRRVLRQWPWAAAAAIVIAAASMARLALREEHYEVTGIEMLTDQARSEGWPTLSPDGRYLVYVGEDTAIESGNLVLRTMADGEELQLTDTPEFETAPAFSPAGDQLAFVRASNPNRPGELRPCEFYVRTFPLGVDRRVGACEVSRFINRLSWTHDGGLIYSEPAPSGGPARIVRLDVASGERRVLVPPPSEGAGDYDSGLIGARLGEPGVWRLPRGGEAPTSITSLAPAVGVGPRALAALSHSHWRVVGDRLYLLVTEPVGAERILVMDLAAGEELRSYPIANEGNYAYLAVDAATGDIFYARSAPEHYAWEVGLMRLRATTN
jgi:class 3 adenylate cyclase